MAIWAAVDVVEYLHLVLELCQGYFLLLEGVELAVEASDRHDFLFEILVRLRDILHSRRA